MESMKDYEKELEASFRRIGEGDIVKGTVIDVNEEEVILDLKYYTQGIIKVENLSNDPEFLSAGKIAVGDEIEASVIRMDDGEGNIELSCKEANDILAWDRLQTLMEQEQIVKVRIKESVPSGVTAYLEGIRAFIPASQIAGDYVEDTEAWVGKEIEAKIINLDREKTKLVLSGKAVAREKEAQERNHRISMMVPGTVTEGIVERIMPYGAFVSLGHGISGLIHISQISQKRIATPHEVLKEGQKVKVKILNTNDNKVSLSMKALEEEMADTETMEEVEEYVSGESVSTSLGDLLANIKL